MATPAPAETFGANHLTKPTSGMETLLAYNPLQLLVGTFGLISRGGHLIVTDDALSFQPHAVNLNIADSQITIPISEIADMQKRQRLAAVILTITTTGGVDYDFVCWKRDAVIAAVEQRR